MPLVPVSIGPVPVSSARSWMTTARRTMRVVRSRPDLGVPLAVMDAFDNYLIDWSLGLEDEVFFWNGSIDPDVLRHLAAHWARLANLAREQPEESGIVVGDPEGEAFFAALAAAMADALARTDDSEQFAAKFADVVPEFNAGAQTPQVDESRSVLLVDDNADIRLLLRIGLEVSGGFSIVGEAGNGQEAVDSVSLRCPDAILLDLSMPIMDGLTALPLLKAKCEHTRVVVFSAFDSPTMRHEVAAKGGFAVLRKDAAITEIADVLRRPDVPVAG